MVPNFLRIEEQSPLVQPWFYFMSFHTVEHIPTIKLDCSSRLEIVFCYVICVLKNHPLDPVQTFVQVLGTLSITWLIMYIFYVVYSLQNIDHRRLSKIIYTDWTTQKILYKLCFQIQFTLLFSFSKSSTLGFVKS